MFTNDWAAHAALVNPFVMSRVNNHYHDAADVVQNALLSAFLGQNGFRGDGACDEKKWLFVICANAAISHHR